MPSSRRRPLAALVSLLLTLALLALAAPCALGWSTSDCEDACDPPTMSLLHPLEPFAVQTRPQAYAVFWGPWWQTRAALPERTWIEGTLGTLRGSPYASILSQYYSYPTLEGLAPSQVPQDALALAPRAHISADWALAGSWTVASAPYDDPRIDFRDGGISLVDEAARAVVSEGLMARGISLSPEATVIVFAQSAPATGHRHLAVEGQCLGAHIRTDLPEGKVASLAVIWTLHTRHQFACGANPSTKGATHEWAESITDPSEGGWRDSDGQEVADECSELHGQRTWLRLPDGRAIHPVVSDLWSEEAQACAH